MEFILGVAFLVFIVYMLFGTICLIVESLKPRKRHRQNHSFKKTRNAERRKTTESFNAIRNSKYTVKYLEKNIDDLNLVYFIVNRNFNSVKIGVGQIGRLNQLLNSTVSRNIDGLKVGWEVLRVAYFQDMKDAYKAESKVLFYWRKELNLTEHLSAKDMGFTQMKLVNKRVWLQSGGHTETVNIDNICKSFTWNLILNSDGIIREEPKYLTNEITHSNCEHLHLFSEERYKSRTNLKKSPKKAASSNPEFSPEELLWGKITKLGGETNCWVWNSARSNGYAIGNYQGKLELIHRVTWSIAEGEIPKKSFLRNECGVRNCVNPKHWRIEISQDYKCLNQDCERKSESVTKPGLCKTCRQREKRKRRKERSDNL